MLIHFNNKLLFLSLPSTWFTCKRVYVLTRLVEGSKFVSIVPADALPPKMAIGGQSLLKVCASFSFEEIVKRGIQRIRLYYAW